MSNQSPIPRFRPGFIPLLSLLVCLLFLICIGPGSTQGLAAQVTLAWDANTDPGVAGYKLYYGTASRTYGTSVDVGKVTQYTLTGIVEGTNCYFAVTAYDTNRNESAFSTELECFTLVPAPGVNGAISPSSAVVVSRGMNQSFTVTPAANYAIADVLVDAASAGPVATYTFSNVNSNHSLSASFAVVGYSHLISASAGTNGTISPTGSVSVSHGANQIFTITANTGYQVQNVLVDGASVGAVTSYTFSNVTATHTIAASFVAKTYAIAASAGTNGTISPTGSVSVSHGANQAFTITANTGYQVQNVLVDGASIGALTSYTFSNVTAAHTISASFVAKTYAIAASAGVNGAISPTGSVSVSHGANQAFTITANTGYQVQNVLVDGASVGAVTSYTFTNVTAAHTIAASFIAKTYAIAASAGTNGSISPTGSVSVSHGASQAFTITPNTGYQVQNVLVDGASVGAVTTYTFTNVTAAHTISASFIAKTYTIAASAGTNGSISPTGSVSVSHGANQTFTITPNTGYKVQAVLADGASVGAVTSYTFSNVTANHTISASFSLNVSYTIDINPTTLSFTAIAGSVPSNQTIAVSISGGGSLSWTATADSAAPAWLAVSPGSGTGSASLTVSVNTTGILPGTYNKSITLTAPGATNTPRIIPVTLVVNAAGTIRFDFGYPDRASLVSDGWDFMALTPSGGARNTEQTVGAMVSYDQVAHPGVLRIPADSGDLWESSNDTRNTLFRDLPADWKSIRLKLASFSPSTDYQEAGLVAYQDDDNYVNVMREYNSGNEVNVYRESNGSVSVINSVSQSATQNLYLRLDRDAPTEKISAYYSLDGANWTSLGDVIQSLTNPRFGIFVGASYGGFPNADFEWAEIESPTQTAKLQISPAALSFSAISGSSSPPAQTVSVSNSGTTGVLNWSLSHNATWLTLTPQTGSTPGSFTVSADPTGLSPGTYSKEITVSATGATNTPQTIPVTLTISAAPLPLTITATAGANGAISPSGSVSVNSGASQSFTITANTGYQVQDVLVDGASVGAVTTYTFTNVTAVHSIAASFIAKTYAIAASAGTNGAISPTGSVSVSHGASQTFTITANTGYQVQNVIVDGASVGAVTTHTFSNVTATHTISASFVAKTYAIAASAGTNGSISPTGSVSVSHGASQTFTITPNTGYQVQNVLVDGASVGAVTTYTFTNVTAVHSIAASFIAKTYAIAASAGTNGTITPTGNVSVSHGASQTFTITPNTGYQVQNVIVDGASVGSLTSYTFSNVTATHTLSATFATSTAAALMELNYEEGSGTTALDSSGSGNTGTISGAVYTTDRAVGTFALSFDGNDRVTVLAKTSLKPATLSVSFWVKHTNDTSTSYGGIIQGAYGNGYAKGFRVLDYQNKPLAQINFGDNKPIAISGNPFVLGEWTHVALTYDHQTIRLYQNGGLVREKAETRNINWDTKTKNLTIGLAQWNFKGMIDKVQLRDYAFSTQQVGQLYVEKGTGSFEPARSYALSSEQAKNSVPATIQKRSTTQKTSSQKTGTSFISLLAGSGPLPGSGGWIEVLSPRGEEAALPVHIDWPEYNKRSGEMRIAAGDIDGDGRDEIVVGLGRVKEAPGIPGGYFAVLDDDFSVLAWGQVEWPEYNQINGETRPACGDIDGDGIAEIIVGLGPGGQGRMEVFKLVDHQLKHVKWLQAGWQDYNRGNGEMRPACGDLDGDGKDEIIAGLGPVDGNPDIPGGVFFIFDQTSAGSTDLRDAGQSDAGGWGVISWPDYNRINGESWPACGDVNGDGRDEIVLGLGKQGAGRFEILGFDLLQNRTQHIAWQQSLLSAGAEVRPACGRLETDAADEIVIGFSQNGRGFMEVFGNAAQNFQPLRQVQTQFTAFQKQESVIWPAVFRLRDQ